MVLVKSAKFCILNLMSSETIKVHAQALAFGGGIVCTPVDSAETRKIFVGGLIPNEEATVKVSGKASNFLHGELVEITKSEVGRRPVPCLYFDQCGGCNLQYMTVERQREAKCEMIGSMLARQAGLKDVPPVVDVSTGLPEFSYRRRATFHLAHDGRIGFYRMGTRDVVPIHKCLIVEDAINEQLKKIHSVAKDLAPYIGCIEVDCSDKLTSICKLRDRITPFKMIHLKKVWNKLGNVQIKYKGKDLVYEKGHFIPAPDVDTGHFTQVNRAGNEKLVAEVLKRVTGRSATELYAGSGNFTFPLAQRGFSVNAVELDPNLVGAGAKEARAKKLDKKIRFFQLSCEKFVRSNPLDELVILDPPRSGALEVIKKGKWHTAQSVIYISCNLPSLARDLKLLTAEHGFNVKELLLVDMFPQTHHTEVIAILSKE